MKFPFTFIIRLIAVLLSINVFASGDTTKVIILSINDQHAKIDNYGQLKAAVDKIRGEYQHVLLFAAGDNFTGNPVVDQYPDKGYPIIDLMNVTGFNASAIGNHEFDYGQETLKKRMQQANFQFLNANIKDSSAKPAFTPYKVFTLDNGIKVGVISAIQRGSNGLPDSHPSNLKGLAFTDGIQELKNYNHIKDSCNVFIALTHLGFEDDIRLAGEMPALNIIMGGHTHTLTKPAHIANGVTIMQAGSSVKNLSKATVYLVDGKVVKIAPEMISLASYVAEDEEVIKKLAIFNDNKELNRVIGTNLSKMEEKDELGSLMTDAVTDLDQVEIAFQNNGGIRIDYLNEGPITVKDVYKLDPFGNEVILVKMKPSEIKSLIINSYYQSDSSIDLQVSGMTYTIIRKSGTNSIDVEMKLADDRKLKKNKSYNVGLSSYIASSYKFDRNDSGKSLFITTAQALINFIEKKKTVDYKGTKRASLKY